MAYVKKLDIAVCENQTLSVKLCGIYSQVNSRFYILQRRVKAQLELSSLILEFRTGIKLFIWS
jgi:hypothetical protein